MSKPLEYNIKINAPREKVWDTMLSDESYRDWTSVFNSAGSYFEGSWEKGSKMLFLGPHEGGKIGGMVARIAESRRPEFVSIEHLGEVVDGKEVMDSEMAKAVAGAHENYTFNEVDGGTELEIHLDGLGDDKQMIEMFEDMWPKALDRLKEICEAD